MAGERVSTGKMSVINKVIYWFLRLFMGGLFIYASIHKITDPLGFAKIVHNFQLSPWYMINFTAVVMPYVELICGLFLILGIFRLGALFTIEFLLGFFTVLIAINIARGLDFTCGCFSNSTEKTFLDIPLITLLRDIVLFFMGLYLFKLEKPYFEKNYKKDERLDTTMPDCHS